MKVISADQAEAMLVTIINKNGLQDDYVRLSAETWLSLGSDWHVSQPAKRDTETMEASLQVYYQGREGDE